MTRAAVIAAFAAMCALAQPAHADADDQAEQFYRIGEKAYRRQNYKEAAKNFDEAYRLAPLPDVAFSAAQAHRLQYYVDRKPEHVERAIALYTAYLAAVTDGGRVGDATQSLGELEPLWRELSAGRTTATVAVEHPTSLMIVVEPPDATVTVDGQPGSQFDNPVPPGEHVVTAEAPGYFPGTKKTVALVSQAMPVELQLEPRPATITLRTDRDAEVSVDGRAAVGRQPVRTIEVPAGPHLIAVTRRGRRAWSRDLDLSRGQTVELDVDLQVTGQRTATKWLFVGTGALVVASAVTGVIAVAAGHEADDIDERRTATSITAEELADYKGLVERRNNYRSAAVILGGLALTAGTAAGLLYYFDTPEAAAPVTPVIGPDGAGVAITGRF